MSLARELTKGLWTDVPVFRMALALCPALAVSTSLQNGLGLGAATTLVLVGSGLVVSATRNLVPERLRLPTRLVVAAGLVTLVDLLLTRRAPGLRESLGIYLPLVAVNCLVLGRTETFAARNGVAASALDGLGMGAGFTLALGLVSLVREVAGTGGVWGRSILGQHYNPALVAVAAPGAFVILGLLVGLQNLIERGRAGGR